MRYRKVPMKLRNKVLDYQEYLWLKQEGVDDSAVMQALPRQFR